MTSNEHPEIAEHFWYDDYFRVYKTRFGVWHSVTKEGREVITALTEEFCVSATRFQLKGEQEGWSGENQVTYDGTVGGKL